MNIALIGGGTQLSYSIDIIEKQNLHNIVGVIDSKLKIGSTVHEYEMSPIEIGFIVPPGTTKRFKVTAAKVTGSGLLSHFEVNDASPPTKWKKSHEHGLITVYELDMIGMNFPGSIIQN